MSRGEVVNKEVTGKEMAYSPAPSFFLLLHPSLSSYLLPLFSSIRLPALPCVLFHSFFFVLHVTSNLHSSDNSKRVSCVCNGLLSFLNFYFRFKADAMPISRLMKDSPRTPLEKTGDWVEYVLRHGGARHLRAQSV